MKPRILIVDDEKDARDILSSILEDEGFLVETGAGGEEALSLLESDRFDLLITDMKMPRISGIDILKKAKQLDPSIEGIVMTGYASLDGAVESLKLGATDFLTKPFDDVEKFVSSVNLALERRRFKIEKDILIARLNAERKRLATTLESIGDGVVSTDERHRVVFMNREAESLTGWSGDEAAGMDLSDIFHAVDAKTFAPIDNPARSAVETGEIVRRPEHAILVAKNGKESFITFNAAPIQNNGDFLLGAVLIFKDVTRQRVIEQELIKSKKLESAGLLAGGIAHDFNNLLTIIMGNLNMANNAVSADIHLTDFLRDAEAASLQARDLVRQFTMFATGGYPQRVRLTVNELIQSIVPVCLSGSSVECVMDLAADLWGVYIDPGQMQQVLNNIVMNAIESMPAEGEVKIKGRNFEIQDAENSSLPLKKGKYVELTIADCGVGISPEDLEKVFDPYFSTKTRGAQRGMGFGLTIARSIIDKNDGVVLIDSRPFEGTEVRIFLPAVFEDGPLVESDAERRPVAAKRRPRFLVMDDDQMMRDVIKVMFKVLGYGVDMSSNGKEAVQLYQQAVEKGEGYDAVVLDLTVRGGMGGKETLDLLRKINPGVKSIISSGHSSNPVMMDFRKHGFDGALPKPYLRKELDEVIRDVLDGDKPEEDDL